MCGGRGVHHEHDGTGRPGVRDGSATRPLMIMVWSPVLLRSGLPELKSSNTGLVIRVPLLLLLPPYACTATP